MRDQVAAADVEFIFECQRNRLRGKCTLQFAVESMNRFHATGSTGRQRNNRIADFYNSGGDLAGEAAEILIGTNDALYRQPK